MRGIGAEVATGCPVPSKLTDPGRSSEEDARHDHGRIERLRPLKEE